MHSLYVDSTSGLVVGLLDSTFNWLHYSELDEKKPSEVIHTEIHQLLLKYHLKISEVNFIFSSGPGSYTGMRLGEGIAQILSWDNVKVYSFHHFQVPKIVGVKKGFWVTNAFKQQVFLYNWDVDQSLDEKSLVNVADFKIMDTALGFTLSSALTAEYSKLKNTKEMIKNEPRLIFDYVIKNKLREPPYYFRTLEEEFK